MAGRIPQPTDRVSTRLVWLFWRFWCRFNIPLVVEHYGSTEMPGDAVLNYFNVPGSCGYVPRTVWADREAKIVRYDVVAESVVRNEVFASVRGGRGGPPKNERMRTLMPGLGGPGRAGWAPDAQAGHCIECGPDEAGEIIFKLPGGTYDGYVGREATMRKLYRDVFAPGDTWWSSGDLLRMGTAGAQEGNEGARALMSVCGRERGPK